MKLPVITALAAAALGFAMAGQATAQPPKATVHFISASPSESASDAETAEDDMQMDAAEDAPSNEVSDATVTEEGSPAADSERAPSESKTFKNELKRMLIGLLLPAVERRVRKSIDSDGDNDASQAGTQDEYASEADSTSEP